MTSLPDRILSKIDKTSSPCWLWTGARSGAGYASLWAEGRVRNGHRYIYEQLVGPVPSGLHLDHLCRVRHCVNPGHLEPVTPKENSARGFAGVARAIQMRTRTHCPQNHQYTPENTVFYGEARWRKCRTCANANSTRQNEKRRASARST